jgi:hypothetical protein
LGPLGWTFLHGPGFLPGIASRFNFKEFKHFQFGNLYYSEETLHMIPLMMEGLLSSEQVYHGQITAGLNTKLYQDLKSLRLGTTNAILETDVTVMARFPDPNDPRIEKIRRLPIFPSIKDN